MLPWVVNIMAAIVEDHARYLWKNANDVYSLLIVRVFLVSRRLWIYVDHFYIKIISIVHSLG